MHESREKLTPSLIECRALEVDQCDGGGEPARLAPVVPDLVVEIDSPGRGPALSADPALRAALSVRSTAYSGRLFYLRCRAASTDERHEAIVERTTRPGS